MRVRGIIEHKKCLAKKPDTGLTIHVHEGAANSGYMVFCPSIFHYRQKHCAFRIGFCFRTNTMGERSVAEERFKCLLFALNIKAYAVNDFLQNQSQFF